MPFTVSVIIQISYKPIGL